MVYLHSPISECKFVDQYTVMENSVNLTDPCGKSKPNNHVYKNRKMLNSPNSPNLPACGQCQNAAIDVAILIAVVCACGFLIYPYMELVFVKFIETVVTTLDLLKEETAKGPIVYGYIGLGSLCTFLAVGGVLMFTGRKCGNPNCKGLRKAAEFDIQLETEECVKNSSNLVKEGVRKGVFELPRDHHRELEAELKKMAPANGRAVLVFRARCGCSVGRMEVPGPKKLRKIKK